MPCPSLTGIGVGAAIGVTRRVAYILPSGGNGRDRRATTRWGTIRWDGRWAEGEADNHRGDPTGRPYRTGWVAGAIVGPRPGGIRSGGMGVGQRARRPIGGATRRVAYIVPGGGGGHDRRATTRRGTIRRDGRWAEGEAANWRGDPPGRPYRTRWGAGTIVGPRPGGGRSGGMGVEQRARRTIGGATRRVARTVPGGGRARSSGHGPAGDDPAGWALSRGRGGQSAGRPDGSPVPYRVGGGRDRRATARRGTIRWDGRWAEGEADNHRGDPPGRLHRTRRGGGHDRRATTRRGTIRRDGR
jgi:hypothetical protein